SVKNALATEELVLFHCEDDATIEKYKEVVCNEIKDYNAKRPPSAELNGFKKIIRAAINIRYKARIYICHISSKILLKEIAKRKREGFNVIGEVTPHHLFFHLSNIENSSVYKVNPPIREVEDVDYLRRAFNKGYFDLVGTDHAPHLLSEKKSNNPPSGFPGLETAFYALYNLYERKLLNLGMIFKMLTNGYKVFNIKKRGEI
ncbi:MAG TPA: dihydroorotase family protein, partial [Spirochaetota bacterium]|nr:dihydroorotase family protein [Spirochaetota bacterium]